MTKDTPGEGLDPKDETGWLIELKPSVVQTPAWFQFSDDDDWTTDASKAVRFARREDAERVISHYGWTEAFASEHIWSSPRSPSVASDTAALPSDPAGLVERLRHEARVFDSEYHGTALLMEEAAEAIAALGRVRPVAVKPLEWRDHTFKESELHTADVPYGQYSITKEDDCEWPFVVRPFITPQSNYETLAEAKADCEADYERRILSALAPSAPQPALPVTCRTVEYKHSSGFPDYYVSIERNGKSLTPYMSKSKGRVEYSVAEWEWLLNDGPKPDILAYDATIPEGASPPAPQPLALIEAAYKEGWHTANDNAPWGSACADHYCEKGWKSSEALANAKRFKTGE